MDDLLSFWQPEPWSRFTAALIAAMAFSRGYIRFSGFSLPPAAAVPARIENKLSGPLGS